MTLETTGLLSNPLCIQKAILDDYEAKLDGAVTIVDANNSFSFLVESFSRIVADATIAEDTKLNTLYPIRAHSVSDLFNHLSDFDYVGFFSSPAPLNLIVMFHKDYLIKNAVSVPGTNFQQVILPTDTIFTIGRFKFGLYYPIQIKINTLVGSIAASFDITNPNPLHSLSTNSIPVKYDTYEGIDLVSITFPVYQFNKTIISETVNPEIGYIKTYQYTDKFYAIRVFDVSGSTPVELAYTMSDSVYDIDIPTVNLKVFTDTNEIKLSLPQIYFTTGLIGKKLRLELYTTAGSLDVSLANLQLSDIAANFAMSSPNTDLTYTNILKTIPTIIITPADTRVVGGSDNFTFTQMKDSVVYHDHSTPVPITKMQLDGFFTTNGFTYMAKIDNLTDRRYYAYKKLYLNDQELGVTQGGLTVLFTENNNNTGIIYQNGGTIVILPTVIYKYLKSIKKFEILDDTTANALKNASNTQLVSILNNNDYFCNPHHIVISTLDRYPTCSFYDLFTTKANNITFMNENSYLSAQLSLISVDIRHLNNGAGGYVVRIGVQRSTDLKNIPNSDIQCCLTTLSREGYRIGVLGTYIGSTTALDIFDFEIATNYEINGSKLNVTNFTALLASPNHYEIGLTGVMYISTFVKKTLFPNTPQDTEIIPYLTIDDETWLGVSLQKFDYTLGTNLDDVLDPNLLTNWTGIQYKLHDTNVPLLYEHDVYEMNADGTLKYSKDPTTGNILTTKLHRIGDPVISNGIPVIKHHIGDTIIDAGGNPISISQRIKDFTIDLSAFEYGNQIVTNDFFIKLSSDLTAYYNTIRTMGDNVLENTNVFFRPIETTSTGRYKINNATIIESSLELSFVFNCYVAQAIVTDQITLTNLKNKVIAIITSHLSDEIISLTEIADDIKTSLISYINSVDVVSLNGDTSIQTLMLTDIDKAPKLGTTLAIGSDGILTYVPNVILNFIALDK